MKRTFPPDERTKERWMERMNAYRHGDQLGLEPQAPDDREVEIGLEPGVRVNRSAYGQLLVYCDHLPYGQTLETALRLGWCRVLEAGAVPVSVSKGEPGETEETDGSGEPEGELGAGRG